MISKKDLSKYRSQIRDLLNQIEKIAFHSAYPDPLIKGTPGEVYRSCGNSTCKCVTEPNGKHGPYPVIQIYKNGKQKQISIKKEQREIWEQAKNYQNQINTIKKLKTRFDELEKLARNIIEERTQEWPS